MRSLFSVSESLFLEGDWNAAIWQAKNDRLTDGKDLARAGSKNDSVELQYRRIMPNDSVASSTYACCYDGADQAET